MAVSPNESTFMAIALKMEEDDFSLRTKTEQLCTVHDFKVPAGELRVGTLDSLMSLSDDLAKMDITAEATVAKMYKQLTDFDEEPDVLGGALPRRRWHGPLQSQHRTRVPPAPW